MYYVVRKYIFSLHHYSKYEAKIQNFYDNIIKKLKNTYLYYLSTSFMVKAKHFDIFFVSLSDSMLART